MTITLVLVVLAFVTTILAAIGKAPLWIAVFMLAMVELIRLFPL